MTNKTGKKEAGRNQIPGSNADFPREYKIAFGTKFIMDPANHRMSRVNTYPFRVLAGARTEKCRG